jgi:hypothetical protein
VQIRLDVERVLHRASVKDQLNTFVAEKAMGRRTACPGRAERGFPAETLFVFRSFDFGFS